MKELSVFVDESGDIGGESDYYLIALVFHDQDDNIQASIARYRQALSDRSIPDVTFHLGPLLHAHDDYRHMDERIFFGKWADFKRGHLKKLRLHLL